jgi:hypothetical protein
MQLDPPNTTRRIYTLFEGTSEIQSLVIARAASGMHIPYSGALLSTVP